MATAVFQVVNLALMNNALTKEMHGAKRGIVLLTFGDGDCNPTDNTKMVNPSITQEMIPNLTELN